MYLLPREQDKLLLHQAGFLAQKRLARGLKLNINEATALLASQLQEFMRDVQDSEEPGLVAKLQSKAKKLLGRKHVLDGVAPRLREIHVEGTLPDGVFLVTIEDPICTDDGDIEAALYGSFLPIPPPEAFPPPSSSLPVIGNVPGAIVPGGGRIVINRGREKIKLMVCNKGDRAIQVGSHYAFSEVNECLVFDRIKALGKRLNIPSGTSKRFEPGEPETEVTLVAIAGNKKVKGGNNLTEFILSHLAAGISDDIFKGFGHLPQPNAPISSVEYSMTREDYISKFGPTVGDRIRLGDTNLWIRIEKDAAEAYYGDEVKFGGGKTIRDGMGQASGRSSEEALDLVITNAVIVDWSGIYKADIGVKGGIIKGIGKAGNPDIMDGVHPNLIIGGSTEVIAGEKLIVTAGAIDVHVHYICPQQVNEALAVGTTTMIGGGTGGPSAGTNATTCTSSPFYIKTMLAATDGVPMNFAFTGKGSDSGRPALEDVVKAGAAGLKLHEDWGSTPATITNCLDVADDYDVQVNIHTDSLNESGFVQSTIKAFGSRTIHTYHTEGAGGGHAPDIIVVCELENVLPSSTNPTRPYAMNTIAEHFDMLVACHHLDKTIAEDIAFANSRIRAETVAAEDVLHDTGALSMISSDSQAMGRVGEVISRTWRTADKLKAARGPLTELDDTPEFDNGRVKRYIAKYTINPAITHGISQYVGSVEVDKLADLVLWKPENFGAKPEMVLKSGVIVWAQVGEANASISTVQPAYGRPMWGSYPSAASLNSMAFVSQISIDSGTIESYKLSKQIRPVVGCRNVKKKDMKWNDSRPKLAVDPENFDVYADGKLADIEVATSVPLARGYNFF